MYTHTHVREDGCIDTIRLDEMPNWDHVRFRTDDHAGPAWVMDGQTVSMSPVHAEHDAFRGNHDTLEFGLAYHDVQDGVAMHATIRNTGPSAVSGIKAGIQLGIDTYMDTFPEWDYKLFPTLLRCEKTHFWGYFMGPLGQLLLITVPEPVASYQLHYKPGLHRIYTATLDLMHPGPLPERHPQHLDRLAPGEGKSWTITFTPLKSLAKVQPVAAHLTVAPQIDMELYTLAEGHTFRGHIYCGASPLERLVVLTPFGEEHPVSYEQISDVAYTCRYTPADGVGIYRVKALGKNGKESEASLAIRHPWSWYLKRARENAVIQEQKASSHTESWYGFFSGYLARKYFPEKTLDDAIDAKFDEVWPLMYDKHTMKPLADFHRIQNHAIAVSVLVDRYQASGNIHDLQFAASLADFIVACQKEDGGYYAGGKTHYTCVIYIAKSLMELIEEEERLGQEVPEWKEHAQRHLASVRRAIDDLERRKSDIQTEGEMTYEDGMISCSYTQLAMYALQYAPADQRQKYIDAALELVHGHRCLSQLLIPDCRMNGGSLRFWESQYDVLTEPNMMNSPHGWSAWRIYGLWYLYLLTGQKNIIEQVYNALGACCQLVDDQTGELRWGFVPDPYVQADYWEEDPERPGIGRSVDKVIGEQYVPMISQWYKAKPNTKMFAYGREQDGGCCDNDVHEIFKCLEEVALTSAYVVEEDDGNLVGYNCSVTKEHDSIQVVPAEDIVCAVHFNLQQEYNIQVAFHNKASLSQYVPSGMHWVRTS